MRFRIELIVILGCILFMTGCGKKRITQKAPLAEIKAELAKLTPVTLTCDITDLPVEEIQVLKLLVRAAKHMDAIFLQQVYEGNPGLLKELERSADPDSKSYLDLFKIMFGPWNRLDGDKPFLNTLPKPEGAGYYPEDITEEEVKDWLQKNPEDRTAFESTFTVIRRKGSSLKAIPYSEYYKRDLKEAAQLLREAAKHTGDKTLAKYLTSRADGFLSNDYFQSDMDWMDLSGDIEVVIGPYEVYEDNLFGYKGAFEAFICVVDPVESKNLTVIGNYLNAMEKNLPIPDQYKTFNRGSSSPFKVANEIFTGGDTKAGVQTLAFNLPNDEKVRTAKGSKKVMLKNVMHAKFDKILMPIVQKTLAEEAQKKVSFDGYFKHILMHEVSHGLGPGEITVNGRNTNVNKELKDLYSTIEECKADVLGLYNAQFLIDNGVFGKELEKTLYASNLGGMFRSIRFGIDEAHGGGVAIQLNFYLDKGAFRIDKEGRFDVDDRAIKKAMTELAGELLLIEAKGDYEGAKEFVKKYRTLRPSVQKALANISDVPVDIHPIYPIENDL
jgi:hypothetical protein